MSFQFGLQWTTMIVIMAISYLPLTIPPVEQNHEENYSKSTGDTSSTGDIISPADQIPPVKSHQNHAQKTAIGDTGDTGGILLKPVEGYRKLADNNINSTTIVRQQQQELEQEQIRFECYHCDKFQTYIKKDYESHVINTHGLGHPCYPSKADIERLGLKGQGKSWEI